MTGRGIRDVISSTIFRVALGIESAKAAARIVA
jgi:hypothetical protein